MGTGVGNTARVLATQHSKHTYHRDEHEVRKCHIPCHSRNLAEVGVELLTYA